MASPPFVAALWFTLPDGEHTILLESESTSLGRSAANDVVLLQGYVSRHHALIIRDGEAYQLIDLSSTHGSYVNGERIDERALLKTGDLIQLGSLDGTKLQLQSQKRRATADSRVPKVNEILSGLTSFFPAPEGDRSPAHASEARQLGQLNFLLSAARAFNAGGGISDILHALLQLTLQLTKVERGFVFLVEDGVMQMAKGLRMDGSEVSEDATVSRSAIRRAIASDSRFSISDTMADVDAAAWSSVLLNNIRSIFCIPLRTRPFEHQPAALLGLLYLDSQIGTGELEAIDHELLDTIAAEAAGLLHNALLAQQEHKARQAREELAVAARIHAGLMSIQLPRLPFATLRGRTVPCQAIGGDFFDAVAFEDHVAIVVADVSGKGVSAAIVAATLQGILHAQFMARQSLDGIASLINQFLCSRDVGKYATLIMLRIFADGRTEYINCGHIQPVTIYQDQVRRLEEGELVVGLIPSATYRTSQYKLRPGERILLATDGITEAENSAGESVGESGLAAIAGLETLDHILAYVAAYQAPNVAQDDCTLLDIRFNPEACQEEITR